MRTNFKFRHLPGGIPMGGTPDITELNLASRFGVLRIHRKSCPQHFLAFPPIDLSDKINPAAAVNQYHLLFQYRIAISKSLFNTDFRTIDNSWQPYLTGNTPVHPIGISYRDIPGISGINKNSQPISGHFENLTLVFFVKDRCQ